jgi:integrase
VLSASLSQAVRWGWLDCNPAERAQSPSLERIELRVPTDDEVRSLLTAATERNERWGMLLTLAVPAGARRSELCALR